MYSEEIHDLLETYFHKYNRQGFIADDPISIPRSFSKQQDIEIMGFWAAMLSWGLRKTIISKCKILVEMMQGVPYDFIMNHRESDLKAFLQFKHRTFNATDTLYFIAFFKNYYQKHHSLEQAFCKHFDSEKENIARALVGFQQIFFSLPNFPKHTQKHIGTPARNSACKRLNMFLRWMVRKDKQNVDFGLWKKIKPAQLICPLDVHVERTAKKLSLLVRKPTDWKAAVELTENLKKYDTTDPVKYDFALFGLGIEKLSSFKPNI